MLTVFEGFVLAPDGAPAEGAVVVSSAGGQAVADHAGNFRLEVGVPLDAESIQLTVVSRGGKSLVASSSVALAAASTRVWVGPLLLSSVTSCSPSWLPTFGGRPGTNKNWISALAVFDDGSGPALYAAGNFTTAGGVAANRIAKWDGSSWSALGSGLGYDSPEPTSLALSVFDDGGGPALYVGGAFTTAGGVAANCIAKWNGQSWSALGSGMSGTGDGFARTTSVHALSVFDDGDGPALYAAGQFKYAGGVEAHRIAKWNGSSWSALRGGLSGGGFEVFALTVFDDGGEPALYAGGSFTTAGGVAANNIARWDGSGWSALGSGMDFGVLALSVFDDGGGPALYAAGSFTTAGGVAANSIAKWNGSSWSALGSGMDNRVTSLSVFDDGSGPALHAGGEFTSAGGVAASYLAKWNGSGWSALGSGLNFEVYALSVFDDGGGPALYAGGFFFATADGVPVDHIAKWNGSGWSALGSGMNSNVAAMSVFDDGGGPALYAGGQFTTAGGAAANSIAKWNGSSWSALGSGMNSLVSLVYALSVFDDGGGPALYAGGSFTSAGGVAASRIAKWNGSSWSALGSGLSGSVQALAVFDDGSGPALYAGGSFGGAGAVAANNIAKWNGSSWSALGSGMNSFVLALSVFDDGGGPALYAGGNFTSAGGVAANHIAKWDGSSWAALGSGMDNRVSAISVFDDGGGPALCAGGHFTSAGGVAANHIAKWNGSSWAALGSGMNNAVKALSVFDDGGGPALYAGGDFDVTFDSGDSFLAKWGNEPQPVLSCPQAVYAKDVGSPGEFVSFTVSATDCFDPAPTVVCVPPSGSFFPRGSTLVTCTATDTFGNQTTCQFPVIVQVKPSRPAPPRPPPPR